MYQLLTLQRNTYKVQLAIMNQNQKGTLATPA